jgi:dynein heavy chain
VFQHADTFRQQIGNLDLIVGLHNKIQTSILPVEKPLVAQMLVDVEAHLRKVRQWSLPGNLCCMLACALRLGPVAMCARLSRRPCCRLLRDMCLGCFLCSVSLSDGMTSALFCVDEQHMAPSCHLQGLEVLNWKADNIDGFIREALDLVREVDLILTTIKDNVKRTREILKLWERNLMFDRKEGKTCEPVRKAATSLLCPVCNIVPVLVCAGLAYVMEVA